MSETLQSMLDAVPDSYQKTVGFPTYDYLAAADIRIGETQSRIEAAEKRLDPENLTGAELDAYIYPRTGQVRNAATYAVGAVQVTGTGMVSAGDLFESGGGIQFAATLAVSIGGTGSVPIRCTQPGAVGNLPAGSITMMPVQIAGIVNVSNLGTTTDGYDAETDEAYYTRFLLRLQTPPTSGNQYHYRSWALEVSGVGGVQVYPLGRGDNTVDVVLIDTEGLPASSLLVEAVQRHIDPESMGVGAGEAPIGAYCYVNAATGVPLDLTLTVTALPGAAHAEVTQAIETAVAAYLKSVAFAADYVSYAKIAAVILDAPGVQDFEGLLVNGGTANVPIVARQTAVLGEVTVSYAE
ncbi:baseplate J/gp47 family protein [uncultured Oscillibacter sp.]|uniref:baseplate J/gp47 family protein n=1 Tax=uncultured Oscillibacter sp. TaxID=876091 RepID=UPI0025D2DCCF|nr:baseplate J/gp47 family protein [uncultured Oscillibacter sp.]